MVEFSVVITSTSIGSGATPGGDRAGLGDFPLGLPTFGGGVDWSAILVLP